MPPVVGPAVPPSQALPPPPPIETDAWQAPPPPQQPWGWQGPPPPEAGAPQGPPPPGYYPPPGYPPQAGPYDQPQGPPPPGYAWPPPPTGFYPLPPPASPYQDDGKTRNALILSICGLAMAICCAPAGVVMGAIGVAMASAQRGRAQREGRTDDPANVAFWLGITAIIVGLLNFLAGQVMMMMNPNMLEDVLGGFMNR